MNKETFKIAFAYILICLIWGSTWLAIRIGLDDLTPFISSGVRFIAASVIIRLIMQYKNIKLQTDKTSVILYLILGVFSYVLPFGLVYWGQQYIASGLASIIFGVYPFFIALFSFFLLPDERINLSQIVAIVLGFSGIVVIFSDNLSIGMNFNFLAMSAVFMSGVLQAGIAVLIKKYGSNLNPLSMNYIPMLIAGIVLSVLGYSFEDKTKLNFSFQAVSSIVFLAVFGSVIAFSTYYWLFKKTSIVLMALIGFITPVVSVIIGYIFLGEKLTQRHLAGSILVLCGILFANLGNAIYFIFKNRFLNKKVS